MPKRGLKTGPPDYEVEVKTTRQRRSKLLILQLYLFHFQNINFKFIALFFDCSLAGRISSRQNDNKELVHNMCEEKFLKTATYYFKARDGDDTNWIQVGLNYVGVRFINAWSSDRAINISRECVPDNSGKKAEPKETNFVIKFRGINRNLPITATN